MISDWNPTQYLAFSNQRQRPALDLLTRIPIETPGIIYDLGCGPGTTTVLIKKRWPDAQLTGVDSSREMLDTARTVDKEITWQVGDLNEWQPSEPCDLLFSNAALHWLDDHEVLFPRLLKGLRPGGVLAVQMPRNFSAPTHTAISDTVRSGHWRPRLEPYLREKPVYDPSVYYDILKNHTASVDMWETTYFHLLEGEDPVVEWTKGSILRPLLSLLDKADIEVFLEDYRGRVSEAYPRGQDGKTVMPFKRLFFVAVT